MTMRGLLVDEKILLAAGTLSAEGFTAEELVVTTFKHFPKDFCLMGFPEYPDSNKVLTQITTSKRGLQRRGWLVQVGTKRYQLTGEGRRHSQALRPEESINGVRLDDRDVADMLLHWLRSDARQKFKEGKEGNISEREALAYWGLTSGASAAKTNGALAIAESAVRLLLENVEHGSHTQIHHIRSVSPAEAEQLTNLHQYLRTRFSEALKFLQNQRR